MLNRMTPAESLAEVQAAITACLKSQEYATGDGLKQARARLDFLTAREEVLLRRVQDSENGGGMSSVGMIDSPR